MVSSLGESWEAEKLPVAGNNHKAPNMDVNKYGRFSWEAVKVRMFHPQTVFLLDATLLLIILIRRIGKFSKKQILKC